MQRVTSRKALKEPSPTAADVSTNAVGEVVVGDPIRTRITFRTKPGALKPEQLESRNYYAGLFPLCYVAVWAEGKHPKQPQNRYFAYLPGEDDPRGFASEPRLHAFLYESLLAVPNLRPPR